MIRLSLVSVGMVEETASVILVLRAPDIERVLVMEVGLLEGRAIAMAAEGVKAPRPLTHDLLSQVVERLGASIAEVQIREFRDQTFFANLVLVEAGGGQILFDARPSDAIALAIQSGAPIYATEEVLAAAGVEPEVADSDDEEDDEEEGPAPGEDEDEDEDEQVVH